MVCIIEVRRFKTWVRSQRAAEGQADEMLPLSVRLVGQVAHHKSGSNGSVGMAEADADHGLALYELNICAMAPPILSDSIHVQTSDVQGRGTPGQPQKAVRPKPLKEAPIPIGVLVVRHLLRSPWRVGCVSGLLRKAVGW